MAYVKIRLRRGTAAQWEYANPVLSEGEIAIEAPDEGVGTGLVNFKIGDGVTAWQNLPYAFEAKTTSQDLSQAISDINDLKDGFETVSNKIEELTTESSSLRRVDIQEEEPTDPVLGQIWIETDIVHGDLVIDPKNVSVQVGSEQTIRASSTLVPGADSISWSVTGDTNAVSIIQQSEVTSNPYVKILGMVAGTCRINATAIYNGKGISTVSCTVQILQTGSMQLTPSSIRLVSGNTAALSLAILDSMPYDRISWSTSNSNTELSNTGETGATVKAVQAGGQSTVYARAIYNNQTIYTASTTVMTVGMSLTASAFNMLAGSQTAINISNSMVKGTDYDTITWNVSDSTIATILTSSETTATITAAKAGTTVIQAIASLSGTTVQRVQATIRVTGQLALDTTVQNINVGDTFGLRLTNTLGANDYDEIRWQTTREDIVIVQSSTTTTAVCKAIGSGNCVISAVAYKDGVAIGIEGTASCTCTVTGAIKLPAAMSTNITAGNTIDVTAVCTLNSSDYNAIQWTSNNSDALTVVSEASNPLIAHITGVNAGNATLTVRAILNGNVVSSDSIVMTVNNPLPVGSMSISPASAVIAPNDTITLSLANSYQQNTQWDTVLWQSDMPSIAYVQQKNNSSATIKGLAVGPCTITAQLLLGGVAVDGATTTAEIVVSGDISIRNKDNIGTNVAIGDSVAMVCDNNIYPSLFGNVEWTSSDTSIATFSSNSASACTVNFVKAGSVTISVVAYDKGGDIFQTDTIRFLVEGDIEISGDSSEMNIGEIRTINLTNTLEDGTWTRIDWSASDTDIVSLTGGTNTGVSITSRAPGRVTITATAMNNTTEVKSDTFDLLVQGTLTIADPADTNIVEGSDLVVNGNSSLVSGTYDHIEWTSSNDNIFTATTYGNDLEVTVHAEGVGTATLTVSAVDIGGNTLYSDDVDLTVVLAPSEMTLSSTEEEIDIGEDVNVNVSINNAVAHNFTTIGAVSSDDAVASVVATGTGTLTAGEGMITITGVAAGTATITVTSTNGEDTLTETVDVTVLTGPEPSEMTLSDDSITVNIGDDSNVNVTVSNADTNNYTTINASSSMDSIATAAVTNDGVLASGSCMVTIHGVSAGTATITITSNNGTTVLTKDVEVEVNEVVVP